MKHKIKIIICLLISFQSVLGQKFTSKKTFYTKIDNIEFSFSQEYKKNERKKLIKDIFSAIQQNLKVIEEPDFKDDITVTFLFDRSDLLKFAGVRGSGLAFPDRKAIFLIKDLPPIKHEMMHLITMLKWGIPDESVTWMNEGLATYAINSCNTYNVSQIYSFLLKTNRLIDFQKLSADFYSNPEMIAYHQCAYIDKYLIDNFGWQKFIKLWKEGMQSFEKIYGFNSNKLLENVNEYSKKEIPDVPKIDWETFKKGCD